MANLGLVHELLRLEFLGSQVLSGQERHREAGEVRWRYHKVGALVRHAQAISEASMRPARPQILKRIEAKKGQTLNKDDEDQLATEFGLWSVQAWKEQLFQCLEMFTAGDAKKHILTADESTYSLPGAGWQIKATR